VVVGFFGIKHDSRPGFELLSITDSATLLPAELVVIDLLNSLESRTTTLLYPAFLSSKMSWWWTLLIAGEPFTLGYSQR